MVVLLQVLGRAAITRQVNTTRSVLANSKLSQINTSTTLSGAVSALPDCLPRVSSFHPSITKSYTTAQNSNQSKSIKSPSRIPYVAGGAILLTASAAIWTYSSSKTGIPPAHSASMSAGNGDGSLGLTHAQINAVLHENQKSLTLRKTPPKVHGKDVFSTIFGSDVHNQVMDESLVVRVDLNSVKSNTPIEDYHCQHVLPHGLLFGVFDGHGGPECGQVVSQLLPHYITKSLSALPAPSPSQSGDARRQAVMGAISQAFVKLDDDIVHARLDKPGSIALNNAKGSDVIAHLITALAGSCALITYIEGTDVYTACTGDSRAILGRRRLDTGGITAIPLSEDQTTRNPKEYERLLVEHPGEDETVVVRGRILGGLMPTRAFGDSKYKWDARTQQTILSLLNPSRPPALPRNFKTPPYVTAKPVITHHTLDPIRDRFLVLATDGLYDEIPSEDVADIVGGMMLRQGMIDGAISGLDGKPWALPIGTARVNTDDGTEKAIDRWDFSEDTNASTCLIRNALGGDAARQFSDTGRNKKVMAPAERLSKILAIPPPFSRRYRDDVTVTVLFFGDEVLKKEGEPTRESSGFHLDKVVGANLDRNSLLPGDARRPVDRKDRLNAWVKEYEGKLGGNKFGTSKL